jgi:hypothetical protein
MESLSPKEKYPGKFHDRRRGVALIQIACACLLLATFLGSAPQARTRAAQTEAYCTGTHQDVSTPLNDLGNRPYVRMDGGNTGFTGGLYPGGSNTRPAAHELAGINISRQIVPLNAMGNPDPSQGKIVMISVGMSNTSMEFVFFMSLADDDASVNPRLVIVNGAQGGQISQAWTGPNAPTWQEVNRRLGVAGVSPQQVQVAWVKLTRVGIGDFPAFASALQGDLEIIMHNLKTNYPNIKIVYLSSRTRSYLYWSGLSPEPAAFETGFAVKWLIESQINGDPDLNFDPRRGPVVAPYLSWGPYLWIDGLNPRSDGLVWTQQDLATDCVHPSTNGRQKVAQMLMNFFKRDATARWFRTPSPYTYYLPLVIAGPEE